METPRDGLIDPRATASFKRGGEFDLSDGVTKSRHCTDCLFLIVFLGAYGVLGLVGYQVIANGNPRILQNFAYGTNSKGEHCGVDASVKDFPLTYFTVPAGIDPNVTSDPLQAIKHLTAVCTTECPKASPSGLFPSAAREDAQKVCGLAAEGLCTWYGAHTVRVANYCLDVNLLSDGHASSYEASINDLKNSVGFIVAMFFFALIVGFLWLVLVRSCASVFIWTVLIGMVCAIAIIGCLMFFDAEDIARNSSLDKATVRIVAYVIWGLAALVACIIMCSVRSVRIAASILKTAALFLQDVKAAMIQPILTAFVQLVVLGGFIVLLAYAASMSCKQADRQAAGSPAGTCTFDNGFLDPFCVDFNDDWQPRFVMLFVLLMYFWTSSFLHAYSMFVTAYAAGVWYFSPIEVGRKVLPHGNTFCDFALICRGVGAGIKHVGSFGMGSLIMAICKTVTTCLKFCKKNTGTATNPVMKCVWVISSCIAECVERFARMVTDNAYVQMALVGKGFCTSALVGLSIMVRYPILAAVVAKCSQVFRLMGPLAVMSLTGLVSWPLLQNAHNFQGTLFSNGGISSAWAPMVCVIILAFLVGELMMLPYSTVSKTIFHAFSADKDMQEHSGAAESSGFCHHTPPPLRGFITEFGDDR